MTVQTRTIGMFHYQVGRTDGVSLELDKWKRALEEQGHTVHLCAGELGIAQGTLIEEMYHHRADAKRLYYNTFCELRDYPGEAEYRAELLGLASAIETRFRKFVEEESVDFLIPQNVWSVAVNPAVSIAVTRVMRDMQLPALAHNHDFYWERSSGVALTCGTALELAEKYLPPHDASARHVVINSLAQRELLERKGIKAAVVPNVFNFDGPPWQPDEFSCDLRARIGLQENDVLILQATRVVRRKGIELAVDLVRALDSPDRRATLHERGLYNGQVFGRDSRIVLVMAGYTRDDVNGGIGDLSGAIEHSGLEQVVVLDQRGIAGPGLQPGDVDPFTPVGPHLHPCQRVLVGQVVSRQAYVRVCIHRPG